MALLDDIKKSYKNGGALFRLIYINIAVFIVVGFLFVLYRLFTPGMSLAQLRGNYNENFLTYLMVPSLPAELLRRPWTLITYMFTHFNLFHILFNMLMLYWFGTIFLQYLSRKQLVSTYMIGGLAGALLFVLFMNSFPGLREHLGSTMLGASAAIMAIVVGISIYVPNYTIYMLFLGPVRLKYLALGFIVIDILMIASDNAGGHIAHLGGALYGYWFISRFRKGQDTGKWLNVLLESIASVFKPRPRLNVAYRKGRKFVPDEEFNKRKVTQQKEIDRILDKIAKAGYESLTKQEKETLFNFSDKTRH